MKERDEIIRKNCIILTFFVHNINLYTIFATDYESPDGQLTPCWVWINRTKRALGGKHSPDILKAFTWRFVWNGLKSYKLSDSKFKNRTTTTEVTKGWTVFIRRRDINDMHVKHDVLCADNTNGGKVKPPV